MTIFTLAIAVLLALGIYLFLARTIAKFKIAPPAEPNPDDVRPVHYRYRCTVCGAEVTMTLASSDDPDAPRHCREDMVLAESLGDG